VTAEDVDGLLHRLRDWAAGDRAAAAAAGRSRARSLAEQAAGDATLLGLAVDLAEEAAAVVVSTPSQRWSGRLAGVGADFLLLERSGAGPALLPVEGIAWLERAAASGWAPPGARDRRLDEAGRPAEDWASADSRLRPAGDRRPALALGLAGALEGLAAERAPVCVWSAARPLTGEVLSLGRDVLTLRLDRPATPSLAHIRLARVEAIELR
jgi:hypothetical protein